MCTFCSTRPGSYATDRGGRLTAYDVDDYLVRARLDISDLPVRPRPPFPPDTIDDVYGEADVLVLPSVMRESHSLATREALVRGVPVISTDVLGPEEVVEHGENGLIVPAADAAALAGAVERLLDDRGLRERLGRGARPVPRANRRGPGRGAASPLPRAAGAET